MPNKWILQAVTNQGNMKFEKNDWKKHLNLSLESLWPNINMVTRYSSKKVSTLQLLLSTSANHVFKLKKSHKIWCNKCNKTKLQSMPPGYHIIYQNFGYQWYNITNLKFMVRFPYISAPKRF
jgi:hypothetical protein